MMATSAADAPPSDPHQTAASIKSHNAVVLIRSSSGVSSGLVSSHAIYSSPRIDILQALLLHEFPGQKCLIAVQGHKDILPLAAVLAANGFTSVSGLDGHADIVEFSKEWLAAWSASLVTITSCQSLLHLFCHGFIHLSDLSLLVFDNCTIANNNHPYCLVMQYFYTPMLAKVFASSEPERLVRPRVVGFADWPKTYSENESVFVRKSRTEKLLQYQRTFHSVILPFRCAGGSEVVGWMTEHELERLNTVGVFGKADVLVLRESDDLLIEKMAAVGETLLNLKMAESNVLILCHSRCVAPILEALHLMLPKLNRTGSIVAVSVASVHAAHQLRQAVIVCPLDNPAVITTVLQGNALCKILVLDSVSNSFLHIALMSFCQSVPITYFRTDRADSLHEQAFDMTLWLTAMSASNSAASLPARQVRALLSGFEQIGRMAYMVPDESPFHLRIPESKAVLFPAMAVSLLLKFCSYLPKVAGCGTGLRIKTMPVKRVDKDGLLLDKERHFYLSHVTLPSCLSPRWVAEDRLLTVGPLTPSRFSSQTLASYSAMKLLLASGALDAFLMPSPDILAFAQHQSHLQPANLAETEGIFDYSDDSISPELKEIVPPELQWTAAWDELVSTAAAAPPPVVAEVTFEFYVYAMEYRLGWRGDVTAESRAAIKLPPDSHVFACDDNFFNSHLAQRAFAIVTRTPFPAHLRTVDVPIGASLILKCDLRLVDGQASRLTQRQVGVLIRAQAVLFGAINVRPMVIAGQGESVGGAGMDIVGGGTGENEDMEEEEDEAMERIPNDKQTVYMVGMLKRPEASSLRNCHDLDAIWKVYTEQFVPKASLNIELLNLDEQPKGTRWSLDWETMELLVSPPASRLSLLEYLHALETFIATKVHPESPVFENLPGKEPLVLDFGLFAVRRLLLFAPYNCIFYRAKRVQTDMKPTTEFESKSIPKCRSYGDYLQLRYGLAIRDPEQTLISVKRGENFANLVKWVSRKDLNPNTRRIRQKQFKSVLVPEVIDVLPIPYALVRMLMVVPKAMFDVERQLVAARFFAAKLRIAAEWMPSLPVQVEALTGPTAAALYDYERLEILGDSLLKLCATVDAFVSFPNYGEGKLSSRRQGIVSNTNLYRVALTLDLPFYSRLTPFFPKLWTVPDLRRLFSDSAVEQFPFVPFLFDEGQQRWKLIGTADERAGKRQSLFRLFPDGRLEETGERSNEASKRNAGFYRKRAAGMPTVSRLGFAVPPKSLADLVESTIAAMFVGGYFKAATHFMVQAGLISPRMLDLSGLSPVDVVGWLPGDNASDSHHPTLLVTAVKMNEFSDIPAYTPDESEFPFEVIEATLGYRFQCHRLLFLAMTHSSVDCTYSNERLEWLGDAILDWLVTRYYYDSFDDHKWMTPDRITRARQAAVCNEAFSHVCVHYGLHKHLRVASAFLQLEIEAYVRTIEEEERRNEATDDVLPPAQVEDGTSGLGVVETETAASVELGSKMQAAAPKALGDLFEAIAGAVFIDINFDPDRFAEIYLPLLRWYIDRYADPYDLPDNPIHDFWHDVRIANIPLHTIEFKYIAPSGANVVFPVPGNTAIPAPLTTCQIWIRGRLVAEARGPTRFIARKSTTRLAVIYIRSYGWREFIQ